MERLPNVLHAAHFLSFAGTIAVRRVDRMFFAHNGDMEHAKKKSGNPIVRGWQRGRAAWNVLAAHRFTTVAGTLVFFLIMSLVPFLFWLSLLFGGADALLDRVLELELFGWARDLISFLRANAEGATAGAGIFLIATTLWSSSAFFFHLRRSGEIIYDVRRRGKGLRVRLSAILFTLAAMLGLTLAGGAVLGLTLLTGRLPMWLSVPADLASLLCIGFLAAWLLNVYACPYRGETRALAPGSFYTALAWLVASAAFSVYFRFSNPERLYGALALVIVFLLWLYWLMICFTAGMVYNRRALTAKKNCEK